MSEKFDAANIRTDLESIDRLNVAGIPSQLVGGDRPASIEGKKYLHSSPSENRTYVGGETMRFSLPCQPNTYLMPDVQLKFNINTVAGDCVLDYGASAVISRLRIFHGSQLLEDCQNYNRLRSIITDLTQSPVNSSTISSVLEGTPASDDSLAAAAGTGDIDTIIGATKIVPRQRVVPNANATATGIIIGTQSTYTVSLVSSLIGSLNPKAIPCGACTGSNFRVEITLAANNDAIICIGAQLPVWTINNAELRSTYVQVSNTAQALIDRATEGRYIINSSTYAHSQSNVAAADTNASILLPFSYSSLKHIVHGAYNVVNNNNRLNYTVSGRSQAHIGDVFWQIGAARVPSNPLTGTNDIITEACKCYGVSSDLLQVSNHLTRQNVGVVNCTTASSVLAPVVVGSMHEQGRFTMGLDLETFGATSSAHRIENGVNTTALQMFLNITGTAAFGAIYEIHSWACYDILYTCQNGQMYARF